MTADDRGFERITVQFPPEPPVLTRQSSRILLAILVELTEIEAPDGPSGKGTHDC